MRLALPLIAASLLVALASRAGAQDSTAGEITLAPMIAAQSWAPKTTPPTPPSTDFGGAALVDMWAEYGVLRVGATLGVVPLTSEFAQHARVLLPVGPSIALSFHDEGSHVTIEPRARGGIWAGATDFGLAVDVWGSFGLWLGYDLGQRVVMYVGLDVWVIHAQDRQDDAPPMTTGYGTFVFVAPGLSVSWRP